MPLQPDIHSGRLWSEAGERKVGWVAEVAPALHVHRTYSFAVPSEIASTVSIGQRVRIKFGKSARPAIGFVVSLDQRAWDSTLRPLVALEDERSFLTLPLIELGREIAAHYTCPLGLTLKAMTPEGVRQSRGMRTVRYARLTAATSDEATNAIRMTPLRTAIVDTLSANSESMRVNDLLERTGGSSAILRALVRAGLVTIESRKELAEDIEIQTPVVEPSFDLNEEQLTAIRSITQSVEAGRFHVSLLFGVSGSGKTEVYIRAMQHVLDRGGQAILLVPEIVLTTQLVQRLASRFSRVALQHSGMTEAQRSILWRQVATGERNVVIGTRSAVLAPCPNLGLICVDEEQESSFKNMQAPRFHVRDVAIMRAKLLGIPVVLGSATPSLETWYLSGQRSDYSRLIIRHRVNDRPLPKVYVIDMRDELAEMKQGVILSRTMERLLSETLDRGEQAILLMNRRGFANRLFCPACKNRLTCPHCNVGLVMHSATGQSICHYCRTRMTTPTHCPNITCGQPLQHVGVGTQRVEEIITRLHPSARIKRVDSDTMRHRSHYEQVVSEFAAGDLDVLIGTQMIAKGLDFPMVSFVGVIHADAGGFGADFRAQERLFQLMTQVAGRAGRADRPGHVVVQTMSPDVPAFALAAKHDYESFAELELKTRQRFGLPPFRRLARVVVAHADERVARGETEGIVVRVNEAIASLKLEYADVVGPTPCALVRLRGKYRYDLLIRAHGPGDLRRLMNTLQESHALRSKASVLVDVDPVELA